MRTRSKIVFSIALLGIASVACSSGASQHKAAPARTGTTDRVEFRNDLRKLWEDHITWTRLYIVDALGGSKETGVTAQRLLANQDDIGNAIKPFYGEAAGNQLTALLRRHILGAADLLTAAKAGDTAKVNRAKTAWYANANEIATFLADANPKNWPQADLQKMMKDHLDLTLAEAIDHLQGNYAADVADYDKVHIEILEMADALASGITAQFPDKFA